MYIFLAIILELASVAGSIVIPLNSMINAILEIGKSGYKIDKDILGEIEKRNKNKKEKSKVKKILGWFLLFTPGINLINAGIGYFKFKKSIMKDPEISEAIIPMTEEEKEEYSKIKKRIDKINFMVVTNKKEGYTGFKSSYGKKEEDEEYDLLELFEIQPDKDYDKPYSKDIVNLDESQYREIYDETDEMKIEEEQGPVLKKTLKGPKKM